MTADEISLALKALSAGGFVGFVAAVAAMFVLRNWFGSYLAKKGANTADKEDIRELTREVEAVKAEFTQQSERLKAQLTAQGEQFKARHSLRLAAIDKRLEAHQRAWELWAQLSRTEGDALAKVIAECRTFYDQNCLYLGADARGAFFQAMVYSGDELKEQRDGRSFSEPNMDLLWRIMATGDVITKSVELPGLTELEKDEIGARRRVFISHASGKTA